MNNYIIISHIDITPVMKDIFIRENVKFQRDAYHDMTDICFKDLSIITYDEKNNYTVKVENREAILEPYQFSCKIDGGYGYRGENKIKHIKTYVTRYRTIYKHVYENMLMNDVNYAKGIYMSRIVSLTELDYVFRAFGHLFHNSIEDMYFHSNSHRFYNMETLTINIIEDVNLTYKQECKFKIIMNDMVKYEKEYKYNINLNIVDEEVQREDIENKPSTYCNIM